MYQSVDILIKLSWIKIIAKRSSKLVENFFKEKEDADSTMLPVIFSYLLSDVPCMSNVEGLKGMERDWPRNKTGRSRTVNASASASEGDEGAKNKQINKIDVSEASRECR